MYVTGLCVASYTRAFNDEPIQVLVLMLLQTRLYQRNDHENEQNLMGNQPIVSKITLNVENALSHYTYKQI